MRMWLAVLAAIELGTKAPLPAATFPVADPHDHGLSSAALVDLAAMVQDYVDHNIIVGGSLLIIQNRHCVWCRSYGWQDKETETPMTPDNLCNIRSMTKMVTGAACQILIDEGRVNLNDPVARYLPGFDTDRSRTITVEQLLTHRSGLPLSILTSLDEYPTLYEMANAIGQRGPQFTPGSRFWYSDAGTDCLGAVVEVASGGKLDLFVRARLLEPLGMRNTFYLHEAQTPRNRIASLYMGNRGAWTPVWTPDRPFYPYAWGSQSLYSTPEDYAKFLAMLLDQGLVESQRILSADAVARILTPVSVMTSLGSTKPMPTGFARTQCHYGQMAVLYQSSQGVRTFGHSGSDGTWAWAWPEQDLIICYFTQSRGQATGVRLETEFERLLLNPGAQPTLATIQRYEPYVGWYQADFQSSLGTFSTVEFIVTIHNERLGLDIPGLYIFQLRDASSAGRWYCDSENQMSVSFQRDTAGKVTGLSYYESSQIFTLPKIEKCPQRPPVLDRVEWLSSGPDGSNGPGFRFQLHGTANFRYRTDYSENLLDWMPLQTNLITSSRVEILDRHVASRLRCWYRAQAVD